MNKRIAHLALFTGIILMLGLTPLGFLTLLLVSITTVHIPVIIGSTLYGVKDSIYLGFIFGLTSFIRCFIAPDAVALIMLGTNTGGFELYNVFLIVAILFIPRILTGLFTSVSYKITNKLIKNNGLAIGISAFIGSMTNTIFFLGGLYLFAFDQSSLAFGLTSASPLSFLTFLLGLIAFNGVLEAVVAVIVSVGVCKVLLKNKKTF